MPDQLPGIKPVPIDSLTDRDRPAPACTGVHWQTVNDLFGQIPLDFSEQSRHVIRLLKKAD